MPGAFIPVPVRMFKLAAATVGKGDVVQRLGGFCQVDIEKTMRLLGWSPPVVLDEESRKAAKGYVCETTV